ncbi:MAG: hypothetical protein AAFN91_10305 [Pseudomonadota bacterium]
MNEFARIHTKSEAEITGLLEKLNASLAKTPQLIPMRLQRVVLNFMSGHLADTIQDIEYLLEHDAATHMKLNNLSILAFANGDKRLLSAIEQMPDRDALDDFETVLIGSALIHLGALSEGLDVLDPKGPENDVEVSIIMQNAIDKVPAIMTALSAAQEQGYISLVAEAGTALDPSIISFPNNRVSRKNLDFSRQSRHSERHTDDMADDIGATADLRAAPNTGVETLSPAASPAETKPKMGRPPKNDRGSIKKPYGVSIRTDMIEAIKGALLEGEGKSDFAEEAFKRELARRKAGNHLKK